MRVLRIVAIHIVRGGRLVLCTSSAGGWLLIMVDDDAYEASTNNHNSGGLLLVVGEAGKDLHLNNVCKTRSYYYA